MWKLCPNANCKGKQMLYLGTLIVDGKIEEQGLECITQHEGFIVNCLNHYVLQTSYYEYIQNNGRLEEGQFFRDEV